MQTARVLWGSSRGSCLNRRGHASHGPDPGSTTREDSGPSPRPPLKGASHSGCWEGALSGASGLAPVLLQQHLEAAASQNCCTRPSGAAAAVKPGGQCRLALGALGGGAWGQSWALARLAASGEAHAGEDKEVTVQKALGGRGGPFGTGMEGGPRRQKVGQHLLRAPGRGPGGRQAASADVQRPAGQAGGRHVQ